MRRQPRDAAVNTYVRTRVSGPTARPMRDEPAPVRVAIVVTSTGGGAAAVDDEEGRPHRTGIVL